LSEAAASRQRRELAELRRTVVGLLARSVAGDRAAQSAVKDADRIAARSP
jgi:hypothetical protein